MPEDETIFTNLFRALVFKQHFVLNLLKPTFIAGFFKTK